MFTLFIQNDSWTCQVFLILSHLAWSSNIICGPMIAIAMQWEQASPPPPPLLPAKNTCEQFNYASSYYISCWHWVPYYRHFPHNKCYQNILEQKVFTPFQMSRQMSSDSSYQFAGKKMKLSKLPQDILITNASLKLIMFMLLKVWGQKLTPYKLI